MPVVITLVPAVPGVSDNLFENLFMDKSSILTQQEILEIRRRFPILERKIGEKPLIYLDNTATSQTPDSVVGEINRLYCTSKANVHRGVHTLSQEATDLQEKTRRRVQQ